ncbi:MAG: PDZ domain-containing protein [Gammaproteobacteria bacterium]|nr:PDZ domain-containing protein [Gammaproteobacteria bacterium]
MICYRLRLADLQRHHFEVECRLENPNAEERFSLPSWIPGSYLLREYARHVVSVRATSQGESVAIEKTDKRTWVVEGAKQDLTVTIRVHALDLSVRGAYLDTTRAFFNGTCVFLSVAGREREPVDVTIDAPSEPQSTDWRVATAMTPSEVDARGFGRYTAQDYDELIDHPVEIADFARVEFTAADIAHALVISGRHLTDLERVAADMRQLCETHLSFFGAPAPFDHYVFLGLAVDQGYGGLEHRASASLVFNASDLPKPGEPGVPVEYQRFLSLVSHEYFHAWNVKQLKPAAFSPYRLGERNHTRLMWVFEGITSYYQDLMLLRSDLIGLDAYLNRLAQVLTKTYRTPGRRHQTLAESSFEAWDKLYKPEPNSLNATVSYYSKGAFVALALDLTIRKASRSEISLDSVMLELWKRYGRQGDGVGEQDFERVAAEVAGISLEAFFDAAVRSTDDLPVADLLAEFGLDLELRAAIGPDDLGGTLNRRPTETPVSLGVGFRSAPSGLDLTHVRDGGAAEAAGLSAGDQVIAVDGYRVEARNFAKRLARYAPGDTVTIAYFRRNELRRTEVAIEAAMLDTCSLSAVEHPSEDALALRKSWLGR